MDIKEAENHLILEYISGSKLYGTSTPSSDTDVRGVFILPKEYIFRTDAPKQVEDKKNDRVLYEFKWFIQLLTENNPNIIESILGIPERFILYKNDIWDKILTNRHLFVSKKVRSTFSGYAISQLKRIKSHKKYIMNPPDHKPTRSEFGLSESHSEIPGDN